MESAIKIKRESEFYNGCIRFKVTVANKSDYVVTDVTLDFKIDETILHIVQHDKCSARNGQLQFVLGNIKRHNSTTFTVLFEPLTCTESTDIRCLVTYADHEENMNSTFMEPKEISVICPIMETDQDINIGRLKEFIETLPVKDSRIYEIQSGFDLNRLKTTSQEVVEKHHVRHISTLHRSDGNICEMWYYGRTKVKEYDSVIKVSIFTEDKTVELFAATQTLEALTGLLAEFGREIKDAVELGISGRGNVSLIVRNSKIDRSNLVDLCNMDGTCDKTIIIENSSVTRTGIWPSNHREIDLPRSNIAGVNGNRECPICFNVIDSSNKSLLCKCGAMFCQTCESWFRVEICKPGERPVCEACFTAEQARLAKEREETVRLKAAEEAERKRQEEERLHRQQEEEERKRLEQEELEKRRKEEKRKAEEAARLKAAEEAERKKKEEERQRKEREEAERKRKEELEQRRKEEELKAQEAERKRQEEERLRIECEEASKKPAASIKNSIGTEFVFIPAGEFQMGSPSGEKSLYNDDQPVHKVKISKPFYLGKYLVTQKEWKAVMGSNPSKFKGDNNPVEQVSWDDVQEFVKKLNAKEGTDKYRLPSEAEWEYACRAGTTTSYSFGDDESKLGDYAWYYENSKDGLLFAKKKTHPVGQKKPNPWGLYDMHGNVWEWIQDEWHDSYNGAPADGSAWEDESGSNRVNRGGGWSYVARFCRSASRSLNVPFNRYFALGFRLLRAV